MKEIVIARVDDRACDDCPLSDDLDADCYMITEKILECQIDTNKYVTRKIPETWEELLYLCRNLEIATKDKKRYLYCTALGEIYICLDDSFGKVGFCLTLRNIQNPNRDIIHVNIINFKQNILYNSFDISLSNSIDFIQSVLGVWIEYDN